MAPNLDQCGSGSETPVAPIENSLILVRRDLSPRSRDGIFKLLWSPGIDSSSLCILVGRFDSHIPARFLAFQHSSEFSSKMVSWLQLCASIFRH